MTSRFSSVVQSVGLLGLTLLLAGCGMAGDAAPGAGNPKLADIKPAKSNKVFRAAPDPAVGTTMKSAQGFGIIRDPAAEAYLGGIVSKLMDHWHGDKPERVGIFIESGEGVQGFATPSGDILIPIGAFNRLKNEDQLAALIGHELGHIILKHHEDEEQARDLAELGQLAVAAAFTISSIDNGEMYRYGNTREFRVTNPGAVQKDTVRAVAVQAAMVTLTQDIILNAYSREQELDADVFGAKLAGNSGWDPRAILTLVQGWQDAEAAKRQQRDKLIQSAGIVDGITLSFGQLAGDIISSHPTAEQRAENARQQLQPLFDSIQAKPPVTASFEKAINSPSFARKRTVWGDINRAKALQLEGDFDQANAILRKLANQPDTAHPDSRWLISLAATTPDEGYKLLSSADLRQQATLGFYQQASFRHAARGNYDQAEKVIAAGEKYYREILLPTRIGVVRMQTAKYEQPPENLLKQTADLVQRCEASRDEGLIKSCHAAVSGFNPDDKSKVCGGVINVIAGWAGQAKCSDGQTAKTANAAQNGGGLGGNLIGNILGVGN